MIPALRLQRYQATTLGHQGRYCIGLVHMTNKMDIRVFFQFLMIPAYVGFALCLYPILKIENDALSLGFVGFRLITAMFHFLGVIVLPLFVILSHEFVLSGPFLETGTT